jgi:hypothetical protein
MHIVTWDLKLWTTRNKWTYVYPFKIVTCPTDLVLLFDIQHLRPFSSFINLWLCIRSYLTGSWRMAAHCEPAAVNLLFDAAVKYNQIRQQNVQALYRHLFQQVFFRAEQHTE